MSEYEIFNNEDEIIEIVPEPKKSKKPKATASAKVEKEKCACSLKEYFNMGQLPIILSIIAIFFSLFVRFLPIFGLGGAIAGAVFFFIGFSCVFSALILETINIFKTNKFQINANLILIILAFFVLFI